MSDSNSLVSIVIPTFNAKDNISLLCKELLKVFDDYDEDTRLLVTSHRVQPDIFRDRERGGRDGTVFTDFDDFGVLHNDFKEDIFLNPLNFKPNNL